MLGSHEAFLAVWNPDTGAVLSSVGTGAVSTQAGESLPGPLTVVCVWGCWSSLGGQTRVTLPRQGDGLVAGRGPWPCASPAVSTMGGHCVAGPGLAPPATAYALLLLGAFFL